jgi:hypothetical protein
MGRLVLTLLIFFSVFAFFSEAMIIGSDLPVIYSVTVNYDTIPDRQLLFNGRLWRSMYSNVIGDEFLFSKNWLVGDVNINEITFHNLWLRYDILNDQLLAILNQGTVVQLNKELIKEFTLTFENKKNSFENFNEGTENPIKGFGQVLYKGDIYLIIKHAKQIQQLAIDNKYDEFYQLQTLFILKGGKFCKVTGRRDLINILSDKKQQVQIYIRENKIRIRKKDPESFIPVLKFYDTLKDAV